MPNDDEHETFELPPGDPGLEYWARQARQLPVINAMEQLIEDEPDRFVGLTANGSAHITVHVVDRAVLHEPRPAALLAQARAERIEVVVADGVRSRSELTGIRDDIMRTRPWGDLTDPGSGDVDRRRHRRGHARGGPEEPGPGPGGAAPLRRRGGRDLLRARRHPAAPLYPFPRRLAGAAGGSGRCGRPHRQSHTSVTSSRWPATTSGPAATGPAPSADSSRGDRSRYTGTERHGPPGPRRPRGPDLTADHRQRPVFRIGYSGGAPRITALTGSSLPTLQVSTRPARPSAVPYRASPSCPAVRCSPSELPPAHGCRSNPSPQSCIHDDRARQLRIENPPIRGQYFRAQQRRAATNSSASRRRFGGGVTRPCLTGSCRAIRPWRRVASPAICVPVRMASSTGEAVLRRITGPGCRAGRRGTVGRAR